MFDSFGAYFGMAAAETSCAGVNSAYKDVMCSALDCAFNPQYRNSWMQCLTTEPSAVIATPLVLRKAMERLEGARAALQIALAPAPGVALAPNATAAGDAAGAAAPAPNDDRPAHPMRESS